MLKKQNYCFENNNDFAVIKNDGKFAVIRRVFDSPELFYCVNNPDKLLDSASATLKNSRTTKAGISKLSDGLEVFVKRYNNKGFLYTLKYFFRSARAFKALRNAWFFEQCEVPTPRPMAAVAQRKMRAIVSAHLITETVSNVIPTMDFYELLTKNEDLRKSFAHTVTGYLAKLHDNGISHGDLKLSNIYAKELAPGEYAYGFWDLDGARRLPTALPKFSRTRELARLAASYFELGARIEAETKRDEIIELFVSSYKTNSNVSLNSEALEKEIERYMRKGEKKRLSNIEKT